MCTEPATVPPRKPSFWAVLSSWIEPLTSAAMLRGVRNGPVQASEVSVSLMEISLVSGRRQGRALFGGEGLGRRGLVFRNVAAEGEGSQRRRPDLVEDAGRLGVHLGDDVDLARRRERAAETPDLGGAAGVQEEGPAARRIVAHVLGDDALAG